MSIDIKKWNPWNWFKHEENQGELNISAKSNHDNESYPGFPLSSDSLWNIHKEVDKLFQSMFSRSDINLPGLFGNGSSFGNLNERLLKPSIDIKESKKEYAISIEIPGVEEKDIKLELIDGALSIHGEKKSEKEDKDERYHRIERSYGSFRRVLALPVDANEESIKATFKNGVLTLAIPRKEAAAIDQNKKVIEINKAA
jgi:HSP20 family protein